MLVASIPFSFGFLLPVLCGQSCSKSDPVCYAFDQASGTCTIRSPLEAMYKFMAYNSQDLVTWSLFHVPDVVAVYVDFLVVAVKIDPSCVCDSIHRSQNDGY